ncbi:NAD(P)/FAD-dependent oxidoreductase [Sphingobacterium sp. HMA12]|uniref:NAD(P)/FAD-dependent oxidoreductase n=1 Tax=Sphingobacterium sp. HMA12 TaxID=2050894 RepID=UPI000CE9D084|nr:NAD(P)/FAD-dependent oxidoreductase [Sphingobacterium sp. HMA12]
MAVNPDVIIIGGGLAGLTSALHLTRQGLKVTLIEKHSYPHHKVCGEYLSNEILPYLCWLNVNINELHPTHIQHLKFTAQNGKSAQVRLPLGGIGVSRYCLDDFLYHKAKANGCAIVIASVSGISFSDDIFEVSIQDQVLRAKIVLGAFGKRSNIDQVLARDFMKRTSKWMAVKAHYSGDFPDGQIALHNFPGGYCGISKVEHNTINLCYLTDVEIFKKYKNVVDHQKNVLSKNSQLKYFFDHNTLLFDKPLTISQISFEQKKVVEDHILMIGDAASLIHPFCGNGMAMAIHSAKIASELIVDYCAGKITSRKGLEKRYINQWRKNFAIRLFFGRILAKVLRYKVGVRVLMRIAALFPAVLTWIIKRTHGNMKQIKWG